MPVSPRRKEAARTIKRAVMKSHVKGVFFNYTSNKYRNIKSGKAPVSAAALFRRMKMFPVTINTPLYRGIINKNGKLMKQLRNSGNIQNSFASFSRLESTARRFFEYRQGANAERLIFVLPPGRYPAINSRTFRSNAPLEMEVLLAPGKYTLNKTKPSNSGILHLKYAPSNKLIYHAYN
jgi:hypothetical protein